jgi:hypothetical protein
MLDGRPSSRIAFLGEHTYKTIFASGGIAMPEIGLDLIQLLFRLLPGFVAAWVFFGLTAHPRSTPFERVVHALIFTAIIQAAVTILRWIALAAVGPVGFRGVWSNEVEIVSSVVLAFLLGASFAYLSNYDIVHRYLRQRGITRRTSFPGEWFSAFHRFPNRYVVLHLTDQRRLFGWPEEWPDHADAGHFALAEPVWLLDNNIRVPMLAVERFLIAARDVRFVEFVKYDDELGVPLKAIQDENEKTARLYETA